MYCILDVETTSKDPWRGEILSLGAIIANERLEKLDEIELKCRPLNYYHWDKESEEYHKISIKESLRFPDPDESLNRFCEWLDTYNPFKQYSLVCHALPFRSPIDLYDRNFIFSWFWNNDSRDRYYRYFDESKIRSTISRKRKQTLARWGLKDQKLGTWGEKLGIKFRHHSALDDAMLCYEVLKFQETHKGFE